MLVRVFPIRGIDPLFVSLFMWKTDVGSFDELKTELKYALVV